MIAPYPWHHDALAGLLAHRERLSHALLVHGPAGIGKTQFARALAAAVLCESPRAGLACGVCPSCHWLGQGNHPDFREIVPESEQEEEEGGEGGEADTGKPEKAKSVVIKIEQIRAVADFISLTTHRAGYRVLLLHPAEALQAAAANALLKTLEEPPPGTLIVLVSDRPARLLATIRSRCRLVTLAAPSAPDALAWLRAEGVDRAQVALALAGGSPLLARDIAQPEEAQFRARLVAELARPGGADPVAFAATIDRDAVERLVFWLQTWVHDLVRMRLAGEPRHHVDFATAIAARAKAADLDALLAFDRELASARSLVAHPLNPRLLAEHLLMAYNRATVGTRP